MSKFNIYLSDNELKSMKNKEDATEYLILQNNKILKERDEMKEELNIIKSQLEEMTEESERYEKSIINLKGFAKNLGEMHKYQVSLDEYRRLYQKETANLFKQQYKEYSALILLMLVMFIGELLALIFGDVFRIVILLSQFILLVITRYVIKEVCSDTMHGTNKKYDELVSKWTGILCDCKKEIYDITKGNDFLNDLIDIQ